MICLTSWRLLTWNTRSPSHTVRKSFGFVSLSCRYACANTHWLDARSRSPRSRDSIDLMLSRVTATPSPGPYFKHGQVTGTRPRDVPITMHHRLYTTIQLYFVCWNKIHTISDKHRSISVFAKEILLLPCFDASIGPGNHEASACQRVAPVWRPKQPLTRRS